MPTTAPTHEPDADEAHEAEPPIPDELVDATDGDELGTTRVDDAETADDLEQSDDGDAGRPGRGVVHRLTGPFRRGGSERVLAVVAVLGVLGTLLFSGLWIADRRADQGEAAMQATGEQFLLALTNFDAATVDEDFDALLDLGAGDFAAEADQFFGGDVREALKEVQASSRGEVRDIYVQSFDGDRGRVFAVVDQTIANNRFPQPQADQLRVELTLHDDGGWHVTDVLVLEAPAASAATTGAAPAAEPSGEGS